MRPAFVFLPYTTLERRARVFSSDSCLSMIFRMNYRMRAYAMIPSSLFYEIEFALRSAFSEEKKETKKSDVLCVSCNKAAVISDTEKKWEQDTPNNNNFLMLQKL
jgi:hypothetical protein